MPYMPSANSTKIDQFIDKIAKQLESVERYFIMLAAHWSMRRMKLVSLSRRLGDKDGERNPGERPFLRSNHDGA